MTTESNRWTAAEIGKLMAEEPMKVLLQEEREKHRQALTAVVWEMAQSIDDQLVRLNRLIRNELGTEVTDGAFNRIKEDMKMVHFLVWRQAKSSRRKAGL